MAAWGGIAVGEQRNSDTHPGHSAILGLLAAALGLKRSEEKKHNALQASTGFAVKVNHRGDLLRDFHTSQVPSQKKGKVYRTRKDEVMHEKLNTILSQRDYRTNASYTVSLWLKGNEEGWTLKEFKLALLKPVFTLYLGRKSCPLGLPLNPQILQVDNLYQSFLQMENRHRDYLGELISPDTEEIYWQGIPFSETGFPQSAFRMQTSRRDVVVSRKRWQFKEREEHYISIPITGETDSCILVE